MLELHIWITFRVTPKNEEDDEADILDIVERIRNQSKKLRWNTINIKSMNAEFYMEASIYANRKVVEVTELFEFVRYISLTASGSYGLIYMLDDDDSTGMDNIFQVFSLARGEIHRFEDHYLSPFIPTVEDI